MWRTRETSRRESNRGTPGFAADFWAAAGAQRGRMGAGEYKHAGLSSPFNIFGWRVLPRLLESGF